MAFKNEAEIVTLIQEMTVLLANFLVYAEGNFVTDFNDVSEAIDAGDDTPEDATMSAALVNVENAMGTVYEAMLELNRTSAAALGRLASCPDLSDPDLCRDFFRQYMTDNSKTILDGGIDKDTATTISGTGAGAGACVISSTDPSGDKIDKGHIETHSLVCTRDFSQGANAGAAHFQIRGEDSSGKRSWEEGGSGVNGESYDYPYGNVRADFGPDQAQAPSGGTISSIGGVNGNLVSNGALENWSGTGTAKLDDWTISAGNTDVTQHTSDPILGDSSAIAAGVFTMYHDFAQSRLKPRSAYALAIKLDRQSSADGTLTVKILDQDAGATHATLTVDVTSLTNDVVSLQKINPFIIPDNAEDLRIQIEWSSRTTGSLKFDDVMVGPATLINGYLETIFDGSYKDSSGNVQGRFKNGDQFDIDTTVGTAGEGEIQNLFFNRPTSRYMPSDESPTWPDA